MGCFGKFLTLEQPHLAGACHQHPGAQVVVTTEVFGGRIDGDVGAEVEGTLQHRGQEGVVDGEQQAALPAQGAERREVGDPEQRVAGGLHQQRLRFRAQRRGDCRGVGGVDAIVGSSGGNASVTGSFKSTNVSYGFVKTETVIDPSGGTNPVSGATIQYTLTVTPNGSATGKSLVVTDPIPADTTYVSGSMTLDGTSLGDSNTDGDAGDYNFTTPGAISVKLGDLAGTSTPQVITFKVKIN